MKVVSSQFTEVVKTVDFLSAPPKQAIDLLASDDLNVSSEIPVLQVPMGTMRFQNTGLGGSIGILTRCTLLLL